MFQILQHHRLFECNIGNILLDILSEMDEFRQPNCQFNSLQGDKWVFFFSSGTDRRIQFSGI